MAERRMFSKTIIDSDLFLDMGLSTQALYFHLSMRADDDGFVNNPKKIQRMIGAGDDELKVLIANNFIIPFESGICVIKHWKIHNFIRNDRYKETLYLEEKEQLEVINSKDYELKKNLGIPNDNQQSTNGIPTVDNGYTQDRDRDRVRLGEDRIGKDRSSSSSDETSNEDDGISEVMRICQKIKLKLKKVDAIDFVDIYGITKVKQALISIKHSTSDITSPSAYLATVLQDISRDKKVEVNINNAANSNNGTNFSNYEQRKSTCNENELIGWDD